MEWRVVAALLAVYGLLKELRPSEPYITPFLMGPDKNFTSEQVNQQIYPVSTYSMLALMVGIFLVTDYLRYKPVIVAQCASAVVTYSIIAWGSGVPVMQFMEVLYGFMWAADVAYFTYMYAMADREHFGTVSAVARVGYLLGRCGSGVVGQISVSVGGLSLLDLQYITIGGAVAALVLAIALPSVPTSAYFHQAALPPGAPGSVNADAEKKNPPGVEPSPSRRSLRQVTLALWSDGKEAFSQLYVVKWSVWWALATAGYLMATSYIQVLWKQTVRDTNTEDPLLNGAIETTYTLLGAGVVWLTTRKKDYSSWGDALVSAWSLAAGALLLVGAFSRSMVVQYAIYVALCSSYHAAITIASSEVAKYVREDAQALVFGLNQFLAMLVQTILTFSVAGEGGLELDIRTQFVIYGGYFLAIGVVFLVIAAAAIASRCSRR